METKKNIWNIIGLSVGILAIIAGILFLDGIIDYNLSVSKSTRFGADFYTEIYEVTRHAADNIIALYKMLRTCFGVLFILIGAIDICAFGNKLYCKQKTTNITETSFSDSKKEMENDKTENIEEYIK